MARAILETSSGLLPPNLYAVELIRTDLGWRVDLGERREHVASPMFEFNNDRPRAWIAMKLRSEHDFSAQDAAAVAARLFEFYPAAPGDRSE